MFHAAGASSLRSIKVSRRETNEGYSYIIESFGVMERNAITLKYETTIARLMLEVSP
jgi:hypothetical protein